MSQARVAPAGGPGAALADRLRSSTRTFDRSTATMLAAKVIGRDGDLYTVQAFVEMRSTSRRAPEGVTATAAYTVTLNRAAHWTVTDVSGSGPAAGARETTPGPGLPPR